MGESAVVLFSGGQDSTACLHLAIAEFGAPNVTAATFFYNQQHAVEVRRAQAIAEKRGVAHKVVDVSVLFSGTESALTDNSNPIQASGGFTDSAVNGGLPTTFVPFRNLIFLTLASSVAFSRKSKTVFAGFCAADDSGYPDCRRTFVKAALDAIQKAAPSSWEVDIRTPLISLSKREIVELAWSLGAECWEDTGRSMTCYRGMTPPCGQCPACELRAKGFRDAGRLDPALEI